MYATRGTPEAAGRPAVCVLVCPGTPVCTKLVVPGWFGRPCPECFGPCWHYAALLHAPLRACVIPSAPLRQSAAQRYPGSVRMVQVVRDHSHSTPPDPMAIGSRTEWSVNLHIGAAICIQACVSAATQVVTPLKLLTAIDFVAYPRTRRQRMLPFQRAHQHRPRLVRPSQMHSST
jgi:hypothetical protein